MEINIPKKFRVGGVDYIVKQVEHCGNYDNFGFTEEMLQFFKDLA